MQPLADEGATPVPGRRLQGVAGPALYRRPTLEDVPRFDDRDRPEALGIVHHVGTDAGRLAPDPDAMAVAGLYSDANDRIVRVSGDGETGDSRQGARGHLRYVDLFGPKVAIAVTHGGDTIPQEDFPFLAAEALAGRLDLARFVTAEIGLDEVPDALDELHAARGIRTVVRL